MNQWLGATESLSESLHSLAAAGVKFHHSPSIWSLKFALQVGE